MRKVCVYALTQKRFVEYFQSQPETGMGYWVADAILKDGREYHQVIVNGGYVTQVKGYTAVPFQENDIDHFVVTHEKWDWYAPQKKAQ